MTTDCIPTKVPVRNVRRKILFYLLILVILAVFLLPFVQVGYWDGRFCLNLDVRSLSGKKIDKVLYASYGNQDVAEHVVTNPNETAYQFELRPAAKTKNGYEAKIPCNGRIGPFNIEYGYGELSYIVVEVTDEKGNRTRKSLHIPEGRGPRTLQVLVP
jgi:hypothetical protein